MRTLSLFLVGCLGFAAACASSERASIDDGTPADKSSTNPTPDQSAADDATPHALGTITLGEAHGAGDGESSPVISASFVPDASKAKITACTHQVGACAVSDVPQCKTGSVSGCATGEVCTFDDSCSATCVKTCTKACDSDEVCIFSSTAPSSDAGMACQKRDRFDAGPIAFAGTTQAITLFPPYSVKPTGNGAPFLAKAQIEVQAEGGVEAGFQSFDDKFMTTTFLETDPPLDEIPRTTIFGSGSVTVGWVPGADTVKIAATGPAGTATCDADDTTGTFDVTRDVLTAVLGSTTTTAPSLTISVTRQRMEIHKDKKAFGSLASGTTVQPTGWLELVTSSSESHSYQACTTGSTACGETCVTTTSDPQNCGACGNVCPSTTPYCSSGVCRVD